MGMIQRFSLSDYALFVYLFAGISDVSDAAFAEFQLYQAGFPAKLVFADGVEPAFEFLIVFFVDNLGKKLAVLHEDLVYYEVVIGMLVLAAEALPV